jgi:hypothetical protein
MGWAIIAAIRWANGKVPGKAMESVMIAGDGRLVVG